MSDSGPSTAAAPDAYEIAPSGGGAEPIGRIRSKSIGTYIDPPTDLESNAPDDASIVTEKTADLSVDDPPTPLVQATTNSGPIRHDQYRGLARTNTDKLHQGDY